MRFKLDENLSRSVADLFRSAGHNAVTGREQGLQSASDERVYEVAAREGRTLVTLDRDFGQVLRFPPDASGGIIVMRWDRAPAIEPCSLVRANCSD